MAHPKAELDSFLAVGVSQTVRADRQLQDRGEWSDLLFYPVSAVLRTGHTTHVKTLLRPVNVLLGRFSALNPAFDLHAYAMRHLQPVITMEGGKVRQKRKWRCLFCMGTHTPNVQVIVLDVNVVQLEFQSNPNMAFVFYRWLAAMMTRKNDRSLTIKV